MFRVAPRVCGTVRRRGSAGVVRSVTAYDREASLGVARLAALVASLLAGVGAALALMPALFRSIPTDISRIGTVLEALHTRGDEPDLVVFGNSSIMSGVDAGVLSEGLDGVSLAWNLSTTGQTLLEAVLLTQELSARTGLVVYSVPLRAGGDEMPLHPQKGNTYHMFGFRPEPELVARLAGVYGEDVRRLLERSPIAQAFAARWAVRQLADTQLRILLRRDLQLLSAESDLLHPQRYTEPVPSAVLQRLLAAHRAALSTAAPGTPVSDRTLLRQLAEAGAARGRRTLVLISPVHPSLLAGRGAAYARGAADVAAAVAGVPGVRVLDASTLLTPKEFIDDLHPTDAGAHRLTRKLAEAIGGAD